MTNIPKKLDGVEGIYAINLRNKINELIDVVKQHRIDFLVYSGFERDELNELLGAKEKAKHKSCNGWGCDKCNQTGYSEEASKGECEHGDTNIDRCDDCEKKRNPPEHEEEWVYGFEDGTIIDLNKIKGKELADLLNTRFVSKEKIEKEIDKELEELRGTTACTFYDFADDLKESLGLGD